MSSTTGVETLEVAHCCPLEAHALENHDLESHMGQVAVSRSQALTAWNRGLREKRLACVAFRVLFSSLFHVAQAGLRIVI